jgi:hypothetical protein
VSTHEGLVADAEDPAVLGKNLAVGARLLASAVVFFFMAFVFAFFYLRALNTNHDFHPAHTNPPTGYGVAILAVRARSRRPPSSWRAARWPTAPAARGESAPCSPSCSAWPP